MSGVHASGDAVAFLGQRASEVGVSVTVVDQYEVLTDSPEPSAATSGKVHGVEALRDERLVRSVTVHDRLSVPA